VNNNGIPSETDGDIALIVTPLTGFEAYSIIAARWISKNARDFLERHAGLYLGVILCRNLAAGSEKADEYEKSRAPQCWEYDNHFSALLKQ
jgi:hypothetical protein